LLQKPPDAAEEVGIDAAQPRRAAKMDLTNTIGLLTTILGIRD
jgi:hypothetical protein